MPHSPDPASLSSSAERELILIRETDVSAEQLFAGWTQPDLLVQWFTPEPWKTISCEIDLRIGGTCRTTMQSPEGENFPNVGVYLEIIPNRKLVFTDAYDAGWEPKPDPFFTAVLTFDPLPGGGTRYTARALHWTTENCEKHAAMGFAEGWAKAFDQLVKLCGGKVTGPAA